MSFLRSTRELKQEVLQLCGELTDGSSQFDSIAVNKLNKVYQGLIAGGNEFGIDIAEPWIWAESRKPIMLELVSAFEGTCTVTNQGVSGTFASAPVISLQDRFLRLGQNPDLYRVATHTAGSSSFTLDQKMLLPSGSYSFKAFKLDYDLFDEVIVVNEFCNKIDFRESSSILTATLASGTYTPGSLCSEIETKLEAAGTQSYTVSFNSITRKFSIAQGGASFSLLFGTGPSIEQSASEIIGFDIQDQTGALSYSSQYALSGIARITKPIVSYREAPSFASSAKDVGKIFMIDAGTYVREFPMNRLREEMPDKFCVIDKKPNGLHKVRFNASVVDESVRVEVNFIPIQRKLVDSVYSFPLVPGSFSEYLVFGAVYFILLEKSDNRAGEYIGAAKAKLNAMVNDNRKGLQLAGNNYGRLVPRQGYVRQFGYYSR